MKHNFGAGPAVLPQEVKIQAIEAIQNFSTSGVSILEVGHRTKEFEDIVEKTEKICLELMNLSEKEYAVIFLQGGATTQFFQIPMNFLSSDKCANYIDTGVWSSKAINAAKDFGKVDIIASSEEKKYSYIPQHFDINPQANYLHITSNNTIYGTQWKSFPKTAIPLMCDMCSDFLSRDLPFSDFSLIYAGAQKNAGIAGTTIVVIKKEVLLHTQKKIPQMLQYQTHIENKSMLNTPPVFAIYVTYLTLSWLKKIGGLKEIEKRNLEKATLMYNTIDAIPLFKGTVQKEFRSTMNACFVAQDQKTEKAFLERCEKENIYGIKGHRTVGGFRASLYNALPLESVQTLCDIMKDFAQKIG